MKQLHRLSLVPILMFCGCATAPTPADEPVPASNYLQEKSSSVDGRLYIGPQPTSADLATLQAEGIKRVVNFRTPGEMAKLYFREEKQLADLGIDYFHIPVGGGDYPYSHSQLSALSDVLQQEGKVLLHCGSGYRASVITVAYLIEKQGMPVNEAVRHAEGWWPLELQDVLNQKFSLTLGSNTK